MTLKSTFHQLVSLHVTYLDICDFVQSNVEEVVLGNQGDQQVIVKTGPKKPRLENLTFKSMVCRKFSYLVQISRGE